MEYPKKVMKRNELVEMGFSKSFLREVAHCGNGIAWKATSQKNSPYLYDTDALEKYRKAMAR